MYSNKHNDIHYTSQKEKYTLDDDNYKSYYDNHRQESNNDNKNISPDLTVNNHNNDLNIKQYKRMLAFLIGWIGLQVINIVLSLCGLGTLITLLCTNLGNADASDGLWMTLIYLITLICVLLVVGRAILANQFVSFKNIKAIKAGIIIGIIVILLSSCYSMIIQQFITVTDNQNEAGVDSILVGAPILGSICIVILAPILEELTYRFGLFGFLKKYSRILAYIVTALIFASIHFNFSTDKATLINELLNVPSYVLAAIGLSYAYDKYGLAGSITAHAFNNFISVIITLLSIWLQAA